MYEYLIQNSVDFLSFIPDWWLITSKIISWILWFIAIGFMINEQDDPASIVCIALPLIGSVSPIYAILNPAMSVIYMICAIIVIIWLLALLFLVFYEVKRKEKKSKDKSINQIKKEYKSKFNI